MSPPEETKSDIPGFPSLGALKAAQREMVRRLRESGDDPSLAGPVAATIEKVRQTGVILDRDEDRAAAQGIIDFWTAVLYRFGQEPGHPELAEFDAEREPPIPEEDCPYVGLDAFSEAQADLFWGRRALVDRLMEAVERNPFLIVSGPSGSGKSSLVMAGMLPRIRSAGGAGQGSNSVTVAGPLVPGSDPVGNLIQACRSAGWPVPGGGDSPPDGAALAAWHDELGARPRVLIVDQFEELFTLANAEQRQAAARMLAAYLGTGRSERRLILTLRQEYREFLPRLEGLGDRTADAWFEVTPMTAPELREVIEQPAAKVGLRFEDGVVNQLIHDLLGEPAGLPLLQFTLLELWKLRNRRRITWDAYRATGGGRVALARGADAVYADLKLEQNQRTCRRLLLRLLTVTEGEEVLRRRVRRRALDDLKDPWLPEVLDRLVKARLVRVTAGDSPDDAQVEIVHEALLRNWPTLNEWIDEEREKLRRRQRLETAAREWDAAGRSYEPPLRGAALEEARLVDKADPLVREYLEEAAWAERRRELRRVVLPSAIAVGFGLLAIVLVFLYRREWSARQEADRARTQEAVERSNAVSAAAAATAASQRLEIQERRARAQVLGLHAQYQVENGYPQRGALLAVEAIRLCEGDPYPVRDALQALYDSTIKLKGLPIVGTDPIFSQNGRLLATSLGGGSNLVWKLDALRTNSDSPPITLVAATDGRLRSTTMSGDGEWVGALSEGKVWLWRLTSVQEPGDRIEGRLAGLAKTDLGAADLSSLHISADGKWMAALQADGAIQVWKLAEFQSSPKVASGPYSDLEISNWGGWIKARRGRSQEDDLWSAELLSKEAHAGPLLTARELLISPNGSWVVGLTNSLFVAWNLEQLKTYRAAEAKVLNSGRPTTVSFNPLGNDLIADFGMYGRIAGPIWIRQGQRQLSLDSQYIRSNDSNVKRWLLSDNDISFFPQKVGTLSDSTLGSFEQIVEPPIYAWDTGLGEWLKIAFYTNRTSIEAWSDSNVKPSLPRIAAEQWIRNGSGIWRLQRSKSSMKLIRLEDLCEIENFKNLTKSTLDRRLESNSIEVAGVEDHLAPLSLSSKSVSENDRNGVPLLNWSFLRGSTNDV